MLIWRFTQASIVSGLHEPLLLPCAPLDWANAGATKTPTVIANMSAVRIRAFLCIVRTSHHFGLPLGSNVSVMWSRRRDLQ